jgi:cation/acetate symporter
MTGNPVPQLGFGDTLVDSSTYLLDKLDQVTTELGFLAYTESSKSTIDIFCITAALMFGTAGLPHVIVRFFTVPTVQDARKSAGYALIFIALLYTTAPAVGAFARMNFIDSIQDTQYSSSPSWFKNWEGIGLIAWNDKNNDGIIHYSAGNTFEDNRPQFIDATGDHGQRLTSNTSDTSNQNEVYIDKDIMVLANPEIAKLPGWVIALVAAGGLAAALSTAAGLLLVISSSISHDLLKKTFKPNISEKQELFYARCAAAVAIVIAGLFGIFPPGFVAQVVAFAFGLAAATIFPALFLGIFSKSMNKEGAIAGMLAGLVFTATYISYFKFINPGLDHSSNWLFSISPEGIGFLGMIINFIISIFVSRFFSKPPSTILSLIDSIRLP